MKKRRDLSEIVKEGNDRIRFLSLGLIVSLNLKVLIFFFFLYCARMNSVFTVKYDGVCFSFYSPFICFSSCIFANEENKYRE